MENNQQETEKQIKKLVQRNRDNYSNLAIGFLVAEMVIRTDSKDNRAADLRYKTIMNTLFGKPEESLAGEKDEELLISAGWQFRFLGFDNEETYKKYKGKSTPEARACREAAKSYVFAKYYDIVDGHQNFTKEHKAEIDKHAGRITDKFTNKRNEYVVLALQQEGMKEDEPSIAVRTTSRRKELDQDLNIISICRTKIINSVDFSFLSTRT